MIKRKVTETIEEYDDTGRLTKKTVTETTEDDDNNYSFIPDAESQWWRQPYCAADTGR